MTETIKSQHETNKCNSGQHETDVLLEALNKCEKLQKKLDIAVKALRGYVNYNDIYKPAQTALKQIKELD